MTLERFAALERLASAVAAWKRAAKESRALSGHFKLQLAEMDARREMFVALADVERTDGAEQATVTITRMPVDSRPSIEACAPQIVDGQVIVPLRVSR